jgi:ABC-type multidrug transport system fused ATPase/permease subunit
LKGHYLFDVFRKVLEMLTRRERTHFAYVIVLILIAGVADMIGVAAILPFLAVVTDPEILETQPILKWAYEFSDAQTPRAFTILLGVGIFAVIIVGLFIKIASVYAASRFGHMRKHHIAMRLLTGYLRQPYIWFLDKHSSELSKSVLQEVDNMVGSSLLPAMRVLTQIVSIILVLGLLIAVEPTVALIAALVLGGSYGAIFFLVRNRLVLLGRDVVHANSARFRSMNEMLGGIKDVKLMGLETVYLGKFRNPSYSHANALIKSQIIGDLPRYLLEAITFGGMILVILLLMRGGDGDLRSVLPVLGLFAVAGMRMLPTIQRVYASLSVIRSGKTVLNLVHRDIMGLRDNEGGYTPRGRGDQVLRMRDAISLNGVSYGYPNASGTVLEDLSLTIDASTTVGIVGGTGAGKTTLIDILLGLLTPDTGTVEVDGVPVTRENLRSWQNNIGYVPQHIFLIDATIAANVAFGVPYAQIDHDRVEEVSRLAELHDFVILELPKGYATEVGERGTRLSGGQRQRVGIARALYHDPEVLILDEATSALDNITEKVVMQAVNNLGHAKTVIMIAHRLTTVKDCDIILYMEQGKIVDSGTYDELRVNNTKFRAMIEAAD